MSQTKINPVVLLQIACGILLGVALHLYGNAKTTPADYDAAKAVLDRYDPNQPSKNDDIVRFARSVKSTKDPITGEHRMVADPTSGFRVR